MKTIHLMAAAAISLVSLGAGVAHASPIVDPVPFSGGACPAGSLRAEANETVKGTSHLDPSDPSTLILDTAGSGVYTYSGPGRLLLRSFNVTSPDTTTAPGQSIQRVNAIGRVGTHLVAFYVETNQHPNSDGENYANSTYTSRSFQSVFVTEPPFTISRVVICQGIGFAHPAPN